MKTIDLGQPPSRAQGHETSGLIVVSNREPYEHRLRRGHLICERTDGGLTSALDRALRRRGGVWVAWGSGEADRDAGSVVRVPPDAPAYRLRRVWLSPSEIDGGYGGYANQVLWPLCHVTLDRVEYRRAYWEAYRSLNERFAAAVLEELQVSRGPVWVHDFHLALVPAMIKHAAPDVAVSFFWHVPWPGPQIFRILPERRELLNGLLGADSLAFQTPGYAKAFLECAREFANADVAAAGDMVRMGEHQTRVTARGIGVDFEAFAAGAASPQVPQSFAVIRRRLGLKAGMRFGLGVDRLDYTKGLLKRLWALDQFFTRYPEYRHTFSFVQIAVPTRSEVEMYRRYRKVIWETVLEINDRHTAGAEDGWQPIIFLEQRIPFETLVAYYRFADLVLVSSVYDGMNLVAKEYVASQSEEAGVLVISHMAGAAEELKEALIVNPYDSEGLADALHEALQMPVDERRERMHAMREHVRTHDIHAWVAACLHDAGGPPASAGEPSGRPEGQPVSPIVVNGID